MGDASSHLSFLPDYEIPHPEGVREVHSQQGDAREWYERSLEESKKKLCHVVESGEKKPWTSKDDEDTETLDPRDPERITVAKPGEDIIEVPICDDDQSKVLKIGSQLDDVSKEALIQFLKTNLDVFA